MQKESIEWELRNSNCGRKKFKFKSACTHYVHVGKLERGVRDEDFGIGFTGFGQTVKKLRGFEDQGLMCDKNNHG